MKLKFKGFLLIVGLLGAVVCTYAQEQLTPVSWEVVVESSSDGEAEVSFNATVDEGWHVYALTVSDDPNAFGPMPTELIFEESDQYELFGMPRESKEAHSDYDKNFDMNVFSHEGEVSFIQSVNLLSEEKVTIKGEVSFMACDNEKCIFPDPFEFEIILE